MLEFHTLWLIKWLISYTCEYLYHHKVVSDATRSVVLNSTSIVQVQKTTLLLRRNTSRINVGHNIISEAFQR